MQNEFDDLKPFINEMKKEYLRHYPEKKDGWKQDWYQTYYYRYSSMPPAVTKHPQDDYLIGLLDKIYEKWKESSNIDELVDMANVQAMIWLRTKTTLQESTIKKNDEK